jgi:hypothetical protein
MLSLLRPKFLIRETADIVNVKQLKDVETRLVKFNE